MKLTDQQLATVLAALRLWQSSRIDGDPAITLELGQIATGDGTFEPLSAEQLDTLCQRLNMAGDVRLVERATQGEIDAAIRTYVSVEGVEIDDDAAVSRGVDDGCWVQAWLWVSTPK